MFPPQTLLPTIVPFDPAAASRTATIFAFEWQEFNFVKRVKAAADATRVVIYGQGQRFGWEEKAPRFVVGCLEYNNNQIDCRSDQILCRGKALGWHDDGLNPSSFLFLSPSRSKGSRSRRRENSKMCITLKGKHRKMDYVNMKYVIMAMKRIRKLN